MKNTLTKKIFATILTATSLATSFVSHADILDYYDLETITLPEGESSVDAVAFLPDGRLICTLSLSKVFTYDPATKEWALFAEGLHTPLGLLPISNTEIYVMQRPELTLMSDRDGDGKADHFKTVSDFFGMSGNYAEFVMGPVEAPDGSLFYSLGTGSENGNLLTDEVRGFYSPQGHFGRMNSPVPYRGWIMKVTTDGQTIPFANGFREPNGIGFDPEGNLFGIDNQGDWVGTSALFHIEQGGFYGHVPGLVWREDFQGGLQPLNTPVEELDQIRTPPAIVFPHGRMANSPTQPLWDTTGGKFGPFEEQLFIGDMDFGRIMRVMLEEVDGQFQGAVTPFFDTTQRSEDPKMHLGNNRLTWAKDGSLWIGQTKHQAWVGESGLQHITWKGVDPMDIKAMNLTEDGFKLTFTRPADSAAVSNPESYSIETYYYDYHEGYGSSQYDRKKVAVSSVDVSEDGLTATLHLEELPAWRVYDLQLDGIKSRDGHDLVNPWIVYTLNHLLQDTPPPPAPIVQEQANPGRQGRGFGGRGRDEHGRKIPFVPAGGVKSIGGPQDFKPIVPQPAENL